MSPARLRQNFFNALVLFLLVGALQSGNAPQIKAVREYIRYALSTDLDLSIVTEKAKGLGSYSSKLSWNDLKQVISREKIVETLSSVRR